MKETKAPPIARLATVTLVLGLGLIPVETAVRAALFGQDFAQQVRTGPPGWLFVLAFAIGTEVLAAVAWFFRPRR